MRLERLQRQLSEAQALVRGWPEPEQISPSPLTSPENKIIESRPSALNIHSDVRSPSIIQLGQTELNSGPAVPTSHETIKYPTIEFLHSPDHGAKLPLHASVAVSNHADRIQPDPVNMKAAVGGLSEAEHRDDSPWSASRADFRTPHQRRRDALANARERLAELQVRADFSAFRRPSGVQLNNHF